MTTAMRKRATARRLAARRQSWRRVHLEVLENRHLLSAVPAATGEPATETDPPFPVIDLNGAAPGTDYSTTVIRMSDAVPIVDPEALLIHSATPELQRVEVGPVQPIPGNWSVDTSGTNITAHVQVGSLVLDGRDTVEHYQKVLRTVALGQGILPAGSVTAFYIRAIDTHGTLGPQSHSLVTFIDPPPPVVEIDGDTSVFTIGGPPVPIADPASLFVQCPVLRSLLRRKSKFRQATREPS